MSEVGLKKCPHCGGTPHSQYHKYCHTTGKSLIKHEPPIKGGEKKVFGLFTFIYAFIIIIAILIIYSLAVPNDKVGWEGVNSKSEDNVENVDDTQKRKDGEIVNPVEEPFDIETEDENEPEEVKQLRGLAKEICHVEKKDNFWTARFLDCIDFVLVKEGKYKQPPKTINGPVRKEIFLESFWIGKFEVTCEQYKMFCRESGSKSRGRCGKKINSNPNHPVIIYPSEESEDEDARKFCDWLSEKTGLSFRLPTENEWEKAAAGPEGRRYPWGNKPPDEMEIEVANYDGYQHRKNIINGTTLAVGTFPKGISYYGCHDMAGQLWELVLLKNSGKRIPKMKGGAFNESQDSIICSSSQGVIDNNVLGFRVLLEVKKQ